MVNKWLTSNKIYSHLRIQFSLTVAHACALAFNQSNCQSAYITYVHRLKNYIHRLMNSLTIFWKLIAIAHDAASESKKV